MRPSSVPLVALLIEAPLQRDRIEPYCCAAALANDHDVPFHDGANPRDAMLSPRVATASPRWIS